MRSLSIIIRESITDVVNSLRIHQDPQTGWINHLKMQGWDHKPMYDGDQIVGHMFFHPEGVTFKELQNTIHHLGYKYDSKLNVDDGEMVVHHNPATRTILTHEDFADDQTGRHHNMGVFLYATKGDEH